MGKRGIAPKPTNLRILHGDRKDRINTDEPTPAAADIVAPSWLDEPAVEVWDRLAPDLVDKGVLTPWDVDSFAQLCSLIVINQDAIDDVRTNGTSCTTVVRELSNGEIIYDLRKNPAWQVARESTALITTLGGRFGLNPSDRSQLKIGDGRGGPKGDDLLS